jgi:hypothetical protein
MPSPCVKNSKYRRPIEHPTNIPGKKIPAGTATP